MAEEAAEARAVDGETPFFIGVLGDFGGEAAGRPVEVDRDNFDEVLAQMEIRLQLPLAGDYPIQELDDFHPDRMSRVVIPAVREYVSSRSASVKPPVARQPSGGLLEQIVEEGTEPELTSAVPTSSEFGEFLEKLVRPHLERPADPRDVRREEHISNAANSVLRATLHVPAFQELEAAWRAIFLLVRRLETSERLKVFLIQMSRRDLAVALEGGGPTRTRLEEMLTDYSERSLDGHRWSVLAANYMFGSNDQDFMLMGGLAGLGKVLGAAVIGGAEPEIAGCRSWEGLAEPEGWDRPAPPGWEALRRSHGARHFGLVMPRFLLRLPYGRETDPCEEIDFEEMEGGPEHGNYLWGNPALACALLLGQAFERHGWEMRPGAVQEIEGLPLHIFKSGGQSRSKSCAETWLTDAAVARILDCGIMPLVSLRNADSVRVARFQSIAAPQSPLSGPWV
jgi:type VI secretion system protein ImpC